MCTSAKSEVAHRVFVAAMGQGASASGLDAGRQAGNANHVYKCLVLGETGSGKTSFMNLLCNLKAVLELGKSKNLEKKSLRRFEEESRTEAAKMIAGKSRTKLAHAYSIPAIPGLAWEITLIDTPGFGDTEGLEEDKKHVSKINQAIEQLGSINCIVLVINGRVARATSNFKYVIANVMSILPKEILSQIVVVFTNCTSMRQVNMELEAVHTAVGFAIPQEYMLPLENPVASVPKLFSQNFSQTVLEREMKCLKSEIVATSQMLHEFFEQISRFRAIPTNLFKEMFEVKSNIEKEAISLNTQLQYLNQQKTKLKNAEEALKSAEDTKKLYENFTEEREEERWVPDNSRSGQHNMICTVPGCHKNCHLDCKIEMGFDKVDVFKDCECFHWKAKKTIKIQTEAHRSDVLCQVCDKEFNIVDTEQDIQRSTETRVASDNNFTVNGVTVYGQPMERTWLNKRFCTTAVGDKNTSVKDIRQASLPYEVSLWDWSNVEKGTGMVCNKCNHRLSEHSHQTTQWTQIKEKKVIIDKVTQDKFQQMSNDVEKKEALKEDLDQQVAKLADEEQEVKQKLKANLSRFGELSGKSSYIGLLNEQQCYIDQLRQVAVQEANMDMVNHLTEQLQTIETLKQATTAVAS